MNENCSRLIDYFNRALTPEETAEFEQHLSECPACRAELEELRSLTEALPYLSEEIGVPAGLKSNVFAAIDAEPDAKSADEPSLKAGTVTAFPEKRRGPAIPILAAALVASLMTNAYLATANRSASPPIEERNWEIAGKAMLAPQEEGDQSNAVALVLSDGSIRELVVDAENLPQLSEGELFQVWILDDGAPKPAGAFQSSGDGSGTITHPLGSEVLSFDTVAITIEKEEGLPAPEGPIILAGSL
ncbi:anti-sigma factor [Sporosarcina trichiuri]|uniref:anti-sigma factor n=1 Tax=Sporosarcina trichiuri TaxID=3056445 RepID=UPI0025B397D9|nr:anti-sigma factor [Sporosarcina sp. 0.2-SM1T-5]WJY27375.1 anti-sigma factor [Sporosarcina sp. 0.2-SM1T-5]